jgi:two-component system sensor histidine kinase KdpD
VGLGLAICREIVNAHDGIIWVADNEPRGSIFSVLLPSAPVSVASPERATAEV